MPISERGHRPAKQTRSQATLERIIEAAESLLEGRPFTDVSVDDIINQADVSRSSFYARFDNKEALLPVLFDRYADRVRAALAEALEVGAAAIPPRLVIEQLIVSYLQFVRHFQVETSTFESTPLGTVQQDLTTHVVEAAVRLYLKSIDRSDDRELAVRVEFATRAIAAVLLRAVGPPQGFAVGMGLDDARLVAELTTMASSYLDVVAGTPEP